LSTVTSGTIIDAVKSKEGLRFDEGGEAYIFVVREVERGFRTDIHQKLAKAKVRFGSSWRHLAEAKDFCRSLLAFDPQDRPTAAEALEHPWMKKKAVGARPADSSRRPESASSTGGGRGPSSVAPLPKIAS
jgi:serine/threonine protein kinase